jgi:PBP1b-binding outer membrane lipoprotein LpoB
MKKMSFIAAVLFLVALGFSSCKSTEDCPAYSKADTEQTSVNA